MRSSWRLSIGSDLFLGLVSSRDLRRRSATRLSCFSCRALALFCVDDRRNSRLSIVISSRLMICSARRSSPAPGEGPRTTRSMTVLKMARRADMAMKIVASMPSAQSGTPLWSVRGGRLAPATSCTACRWSVPGVNVRPRSILDARPEAALQIIRRARPEPSFHEQSGSEY